jgi:putative ABC transport system permease protein
MLGYYLDLAFRSLRRNVALTALMVVVVAFGIGASMTVFTTLRALQLDPIPGKSAQLFVPLINGRRPLPDQLSYTDAKGLMKAHQALRQALMYGGSLQVTAADAAPFAVDSRAASTDCLTAQDDAPVVRRRVGIAVLGF